MKLSTILSAATLFTALVAATPTPANEAVADSAPSQVVWYLPILDRKIIEAMDLINVYH